MLAGNWRYLSLEFKKEIKVIYCVLGGIVIQFTVEAISVKSGKYKALICSKTGPRTVPSGTINISLMNSGMESHERDIEGVS